MRTPAVPPRPSSRADPRPRKAVLSGRVNTFDEFVETCFGERGLSRTASPPGDGPRGWALTVHDWGSVLLPSGRLVIVDPGLELRAIDDSILSCADLGPGRHAVEAAVITPPADADPRIRPMVVAIRISQGTTGEWRPAWVREGKPLGVAVDAGMLAIGDLLATASFPLGGDDWAVWDEMAEDVLRAGRVLVDDGSGTGDVMVVECSMGDGAYAPWVLVDGGERATAVVLDMGVLEWG